MSLGPIEILCVKFSGYFIKDEIASALRTLVENNTIRIIDILFIRKGENGEVIVHEIDELDDVDHSIIDPLISDISGLISEEDVQILAQALDNRSFAAMMLFENTWATAFQNAVLTANGEVLLNERIPKSVVDQAIAAQA